MSLLHHVIDFLFNDLAYDSNIPTKDKKKTLFRFGRKKGIAFILEEEREETLTLY